MTERSALKDAKIEGLVEGEAMGLEKGKIEGKIEVALKKICSF